MFSFKHESKESTSEYPRVIWTETLSDGTLSLVDYSAKALALFAYGSWDRHNIGLLTDAGATYNERLKKDEVNKVPGWVFPKSKAESIIYLNALTGLVVLEHAPSLGGSSKYKPKTKASTPIDSLSRFCYSTSRVSEFEYISQVLTPVEGFTRYGIYGPEDKVNSDIAAYVKKNPGSRVSAELTFKAKKTVVIESPIQ